MYHRVNTKGDRVFYLVNNILLFAVFIIVFILSYTF